MIRVIFRTCEKVNSLHGLPRPFNLDKVSTIKVCFKSLVKSLQNTPHKIYIIADDVSEDLINFFKENCKNIEAVLNKPMGNDESLRQSFDCIEHYQFDDDDFVYFVEDDYLHFHYSFSLIFPFLSKYNVFLHPTDYPDQYTRQDLIIPAIVLLGPANHFRQISSSTFTIMGKVSLFRKYQSHIISSCNGADDGFLSKIYKETPCFCPIPGLATHMHEGTMSPYMDWKSIAEDLK